MFPAYCNLDLPDLPKHIADLVSLSANNLMISKVNSDSDQYRYSSNRVDCQPAELEIEEWVKNNITVGHKPFHLVGIQVVKQNELVPHIDPLLNFPTTQLRRHYTLLYLIDTGNSTDNPFTNFYELIDTNSSTELNVYNKTDLKKIQSVQFTKNSWNLFSNRVIHAVTGMSTPRMGLVIFFFDKELPEFLRDKLDE
jgi:hypothetical protein